MKVYSVRLTGHWIYVTDVVIGAAVPFLTTVPAGEGMAAAVCQTIIAVEGNVCKYYGYRESKLQTWQFSRLNL